ncbi:methylated-DNA-protein-cysteine methyltransferase [Algibacter lectus]|uniref:Methylated-DNA-protein-cysteine methyltransferase n=1 Tax=Algibacter lectus TaxID=221126 RepID=A0A090WPX8_9FLAO|nr:methylated-DNA-protein-cysteine methyltransferase [Algibacter lectus]
MGFTKIVGDVDGITQVTVLNSEEKETDIIPIELEECATQLQEYFEGIRTEFSLKLTRKEQIFKSVFGMP